MQIKGLRIPIIFICACLSLVILTGGQWAYKEFSVERPFIREIINLNNVENVELIGDSDLPKLVIKLGSNADLASFIAQLREIVASNYKRQVELRLIDERNEELNDVLLTSRFYIYEALVNGNYTEMYFELEQVLNSLDLDEWDLTMDNQYIYLKLYQDSAYLYEIIPLNRQMLVIGGDIPYASN